MSYEKSESKKRLSAVFIVLSLLFQSLLFATPVIADGSIQNFSGGFGQIPYSLQGNATISSAGIDLPRNTTITSSSFEITYNDEDDSPGEVWLDIDEDGIWEWAWNGTGKGDYGKQSTFSDGSVTSSTAMQGVAVSGTSFLLPASASIASTDVNFSFAPEVGGGFNNTGTLLDITTADIDSDNLPEVLLLSSNPAGGPGSNTSLGWLGWDASSSSMSPVTWVETCENATAFRIGDVDGDGRTDVGLLDTSEGNLCLHSANPATGGLNASDNISMPAGLIDASLADVDNDGSADLVSIHSNGDLNLRLYSSTLADFDSNVSEGVEMNGTPMPAQLAGLVTGSFHGSAYAESALVLDSTGYATLWNWTNAMWAGPRSSFDGAVRDAVPGDYDGNGYLDVLAATDTNSTMSLFDGVAWTTSDIGSVPLTNTVFADYDADGVKELLIPSAASSQWDGNENTQVGNIAVRPVNSSGVGSTSVTLTPWTAPSLVSIADLDGDGVNEHLVACGESVQGLFIGGWHTASLDINDDGADEVNLVGYAGDGQNGLSPLTWRDEMNTVEQAISGILTGLPSYDDLFGNSIATLTPKFNASGNGEAILEDLLISYDISLRVDRNPYATRNLTNVLNQHMELGTGTVFLHLPVNSSKAGEVLLSNLLIDWIDGALDLSLPDTPVVTLVGLNHTSVVLEWQDAFSWGDDLLGFQVFKVANGSAFDMLSPYASEPVNQTVDFNVSVGASYDYAVRSLHEFGVVSNLSVPVTVTIPFPGPPSLVQNVAVSDADADEGGILSVTWDEVSGDVDHYSLFIHSTDFSSVSNLGPALNVSMNSTSALVSATSATLDAMGNEVSSSTALNDGQDYWVAVVAVNQYGNHSNIVMSDGPAKPLNNTVMPSLLSIDVQLNGGTGADGDLIVRSTTFSVTATLLLDGEPAAGRPMALNISAGAKDWIWSGSTDSEGVWNATSNESTWGDMLATDTYLGDVTFTVAYAGLAGDSATQSISPDDDAITFQAGVEAALAILIDDIEVSSTGDATLSLYLFAQDNRDQPLLQGIMLSWSANNESLTNTLNGSSTIDDSGTTLAALHFPSGGNFSATVTSPAWLHADPDTITAILRPHDFPPVDNGSNNSQITELEAPILECEDWSISNFIDVPAGDAICTITNPNPVAITVDWQIDQWDAPIELGVQALPLTVALGADGSAEFRLQSVRSENLTNAPGSYTFHMVGMARSASLPDLVLDYTANVSIVDNMPTPPTNGNTNTSSNKSSGGEDTDMKPMLYVIGAVAVVATIALLFVIIRSRREEDYDWDEDDLEYDEPASIYSAKGLSGMDDLPAGRPLDEIKPERAKKPSPIVVEEIGEDEAYQDDPFSISRDTPEEETWEEEAGGTEGDDGITTDEDGTEWWEDDDGLWWYRTAEMEDWAVFEE